MARNASPRQPTPQGGRQRGPGARAGGTGWRARLQGWRRHHVDSGRDAAQRLLARPAASLMTVLVIGIALALPTGLGVIVNNLRALTQSWQGRAHISVFMQQDLGTEAQHELAAQWKQWERIKRTRVITPAEALAEYKRLSGFAQALELLSENPLPPVIVVYPTTSDPDVLHDLKQRLNGLEAVDQAQLDLQWVRRLNAMLEVAGRLVSALTLALALGVMLVLFNTIRLAIENRRDEINVIKTVGGTDGFVRRPFLYTGFWTGAAGGLMAVILVQIALWWLSEPVNRLAGLYNSSYSLTGLSPAAFLMLPLFAGILGLLGAWLAVGRHLREVDPRFL